MFICINILIKVYQYINSNNINIKYFNYELNPPFPPSTHYGKPLGSHPQIIQNSFGWFLGWNVLMLRIYRQVEHYYSFEW